MPDTDKALRAFVLSVRLVGLDAPDKVRKCPISPSGVAHAVPLSEIAQIHWTALMR